MTKNTEYANSKIVNSAKKRPENDKLKVNGKVWFKGI